MIGGGLLGAPAWQAWLESASRADWLLPSLIGAVVLCAVLIVASILAHRRTLRDCRGLVLALEEMRAGRLHRRVEVESGALALVADAVNRMRQDVEARLHETESAAERLRVVLDAIRDSAIVTTDSDGDIRSFSPGATALFGWQEDEVLGKAVSLLFDDVSYRAFLPKLARRSLRERGVDARAVLTRRDGGTLQGEVSVRMLREPGREGSGFVLVIRDVSAQARLEDELREAERRYRSLVEGLADGVLIVRDGVLVYANPAFASLCGEETRELDGSRLRERVATGDILLIEEHLAELQDEAGRTETLSCGLIGRDPSSPIHVRLTATAVDYLGEPAVLLLVRDETLERRMEAELRRNERRLDAVIESASDGLLVLVEGPEGGVVQMTNGAFADMVGRQREQLLGLTLGQLLERLGRIGAGGRKIASLLGSGETVRGETLVLGGERPREVEVSVAPLRDSAGRGLGRVLACRDLTEQREAQRRLQRHAEELQLSKVRLEWAYRKLDAANRDLRERSEELDALNRELRTLDEMKSNLLGNVSHELQTPLVSIRGYTEMILKERLGPINEEQRKGLRLCLKNIDRLISMIDNLLAFTRSQPELGQLKLSTFGLAPLIREAEELLGEAIRGRRIRFQVDVEPGDLTVRADRDKLLQVMINLLNNAAKFNRPGGSISVRARAGTAGFVDVQVEDTGIGIPAADLDHVFERNYRAGGDAGTMPEGSGLGLSIVRDILRLHGCRISVESEQERGTRFTLTLPMGQSGQRDEAETPPSPGGSNGRHPEPAPDPAPPAADTNPTDAPATPEPMPADRAEAAPSDHTPERGTGTETPPRFRIIRRPRD